MFEAEGALQPISTEYLDILYLYKDTPNGMDFIASLTEVDDIELFSNEVVQILIDNNW